MASTRTQLRKTLRQQRRSLTAMQQAQAASDLAKRLSSNPVFIRSKRIAFYLASDGEIDPWLLLAAAHQRGKQCYLPVLKPRGEPTLWFARYCPGDVLFPNYFNIPEPAPRAQHIPAWALDLVLLPLVGFDQQGNRLGMGGGYYDRTFAFLQRKPVQTPQLIGLAHSCQEVDALPCENWDVPLSVIATDKAIIHARTYTEI